MAATSPYSPNDYQAVSNFRPYELPINDIFKAISAQNQFWGIGAERVKAVYDNALNLKLSLEPNKEIRKKYLEDSEKQLTKLSNMDLSDPSIQRQGFALFKPLFQDEGIIYDDLTTRHYDKVRNDAMMYRTRDNGKEYSDINFQYAMQGYNEFINSKDRMAGKAFYGNRKEYTPFYDYTEDFSKALKDCKPSSIESTPPVYGENGALTGYMKESYAKSLSAAQARTCLEAGLSTNGQRQLQIEGAVNYRNNLPVLASDTATYLSGVSGNLSTQLQQMAATKAAIQSRKDLSDTEKAEAIEAIDNNLKGTTEELDRTNNSVNKILKGDFTDIQNNFDTYAGSVYSYRKLYKKALASSFEERRENYKADPTQLTAIRFEQDKKLRQIDYNYDVSLEQMKQTHDQNMKLLDLMYGGTGKDGNPYKMADIYRNPLTNEITVNPNLLRETGNVTDTPDVNKKIYTELTNQVSKLNEQDSNNNLRLYNNLVARAERDIPFREALLKGFNYGLTDDEWNRFKVTFANNRFYTSSDQSKMGGLQDTTWFKTYTANKPDDEDVNKWSYENTVIETGLGVLNRKLEIGEAQVAKELGLDKQGMVKPEDIINNSISKMNSVTVDGQTITALDVKNAYDGLPSPVIARRFPQGQGNEEFVEFYTPSGTRLNRNEKRYDPLYNLAGRIENKRKDVASDIEKKRVDVYNRLGFNREPWYFTPNDKAPLVETLKSVLPRDDKGKVMDVSIVSSNFSGGIRISVPGAKMGDDTYLDLIRKAGVGTSAEVTGDGIITIKGTNYNVVQQAIDNPILGQAAFQLASIGETTSFAQTQPGAKVPNSDIKIPVMVRGKQQTMTIETFKNDTRPEFRVYLEGATDPRPIITASNPYELFEKIGRSPMDLNKPIR